MTKYLINLIICSSFWLVQSNGFAADFELDLKESLLNDMIEVMDVKAFEGFIKLGITQQDYSVSVHTLDVTVRNSGITYEATLKVNFMGIEFYLDVEGDAEAGISGNQLLFGLDTLDFPVRVEVPYYGEVNLFTIQTPLAETISWTFNSLFLLGTSEGVMSARLINTSIDTAYESLIVEGDIAY